VVFRSSSEIEANVVRGLLEAHGIGAIVSSDMTRTVFPLAISGQWELRVSVAAGDADRARRLIESHCEEVPKGKVVRLADEYAALETRLGYRFKDVGLLEHALTHRSRAHEDVSGGVIDNESLEFLGDAVLGLVVAERLFRDYPEHDEGRKSKLKSWLVSAQTLGNLAKRLGLGEYLLLGRGEERSGGRRKLALLADGYEALIAALYLDGGLEVARSFIDREFREPLARARDGGFDADVSADYKSALQEWLQARARGLPHYRVAGQTGPDHRKRYEIEVWVGEDLVASAEGPSKKQAAQQAARMALEALTGSEPVVGDRPAPTGRRDPGPEES
jgi:ribonuclease-3